MIPIIEKARQLRQSTLRALDVAKDLRRRVDNLDSEVLELLKELEANEHVA